MSIANTPGSVRERFHDEKNNIVRYVEFLQEKSAITDSDIRDVNTTLTACKLQTVHRRDQKSRLRHYSHDDIMPLLSSIKSVDPTVRAEIDRRKAALIEPKGMDEVFDVENARLAAEWVEHLYMDIDPDMTAAQIAEERARSIALAEQNQSADQEIDSAMLSDVIDHAIQVVFYNKKVETIQRLTQVLRKFDQLQFVARATIPDAEINVLRQGFILLMTAFDAAIFDLVREALRANFFGLIPVFGKDAKESKINLKDMGQFNDFGEFADSIIEIQLKTRYIKDLLHILKLNEVPLFDQRSGATFAMLIELVLRRNVHVHNRGRVDKRYLERDEKGSSRWNLYTLQIGEMAEIGQEYWHQSIELCSYCVDAVANWVDLGAGFYDHSPSR